MAGKYGPGFDELGNRILSAAEQASFAADRAAEVRRAAADLAYARERFGPNVDVVGGQIVPKDNTPLPPGTRSVGGGDRGGVAGYWVTGSDGGPHFSPSVVNGVKLTPTQAAAYALGEGKINQSVIVKTPDGKMVNYATGLDALPNLYNEKTGKYEVISWADHARLFGADPPNAPTIAPPGVVAAPAAGPAAASGPAAAGAGALVSGPPSRSTVTASGVTIGDQEDYTAAARQALHNLGVVNADPYINDALIDRLATTKADLRGITENFRQMQSLDISGITLGQELDYRDASQRALSGLGVMRQVTNEEIRTFASGKMDPEGIHRAFATSAEVLALNPGAQYDLAREDYQRQRGEIERAARGTFDLPETGTAAGTEPGYLREAFTERMAPSEVEAGFEDIQKRLGKAPDVEDVKRFRTRPKIKTAEDRAGPAGRKTAVGPTQDIGAPGPNYVGPRR